MDPKWVHFLFTYIYTHISSIPDEIAYYYCMDELTIGDKIYISSKRAAEITGYAKDYIGQLCREGRVEATLVGRSWYVLETSIRDHRFGSETKSTASQGSSTEQSGQEAVSRSWESPKYESEEVIEVPQVEKRPINLIEEEVPAAPSEPEKRVEATVEDMQTAWRDWFATRNREKLIESPEVIDARAEDEIHVDEDLRGEAIETKQEEELDESDEEEVHITRVVAAQDSVAYDPIPSTPEIEEPVRIQRRDSVAYVAPLPPQAPQRTKTRRKGKNYLAVRALLLSLALIAAAVAVIGTGNADTLLGDDAWTYEPVKYLGGTRTIE